MLLFSTLLNIRPNMGKDDFIRLVIEWNQNSPFKNNIITPMEWHGEHNIQFGDEDHLSLKIVEAANENIIAVRYEKKDEQGVIWDTDYVMNFNEMKMAIRLDRSYSQDSYTGDEKFSVPYFVSCLVQKGYLEDDGDLPITDTPILIDDSNLKTLAEIIMKDRVYALPVVYISRTRDDEEPINAERLARRLKGAAHVLLQKSIRTNHNLMLMAHRKNEYFGGVGIYYPASAMVHRRYISESCEGYDGYVQDRVVKAVLQYSNAQMLDPLYTWSGVNNRLLLNRLISQRMQNMLAEDARRKAEQENILLQESFIEKEKEIRKSAEEKAKENADTLIEAFDDELSSLKRQVEQLIRQNETLSYENQKLKNRLDAQDGVPVLFTGKEKEFFPGEIRDYVISVLNDVMKRQVVEKNTRKADILNDLLLTNIQDDVIRKRQETVKKLLKGYDGMSGKLRQQLTSLGFTVTEDGKHYKLTYYGDERYVFSFAKSPSDFRSGKNNAGTVIKKIF